MSYLVLARKYRPKTFAEMVGQEHVVRALGNALTQQRLHHAYLFTGTRGVGKTTVSRILAKSLNCQGPDGQGGITATPCGVCEACRDIDSGRFVDYVELDAASNRGVDEVQALLEQAVYKPVQGRFKVFMIDEVHMLTGHAFNAMLKTLEEPPEYLKFVLATTDPQKVPVTVLSRCLQFNLRPMAPETVQEHLVQVLRAEGVPASEPALRLLARAARGSMRDALSLTDQAIAFGDGALEESAVRQMLGSADLGHVLRLIEALARGDGRGVVEIADTLRTHALNAAATLEEMCSVLQRMAVIQAVPEAAAAGDSDAAAIARLASLMPADETQLLYGLCLHGRAELGLAPDEYSALTMVLLRLLAFQAPRTGAVAGAAEKKTLNDVAAVAAPPVREQPAAASTRAPESIRGTAPPGRVLPVVESRAERLPPRPAAAPPADAQPAGEVVGVPVHVAPESPRDAAVAVSHVVPTEDGDFWQATVADLVAREAVTALVRELALQSQLVARDEGHWMLRVERESLNQPGSRERLRQALHGAGHAVNISVEVGPVTDSPARRTAAAQALRQRAAEEVICNDPFVQAMMRDFGARIVPGSIKPVSH
ncbi:DNA polymerase III subunit gamma/tau [Ramlibacter sp. RBP-2]|uniref:DNA polymerase III subunit gamma/tau n=1 Tax=Ramlibacter lithotrophicus TaxID=2606681 RepID=A0A7X6DCZ0_9BURK|nr:DNA polymerase III subunit gamma/tau [Ramlibacter lithotrophicus]NKE64902.1 DNA polymerase III subunit gamma/tau [Ramlibacter lithotrophicus]